MRQFRTATLILLGILLLAGCRTVTFSPEDPAPAGVGGEIVPRGPDAPVEQVFLFLHVLHPSNTPMSVHSVLAGWDENTVTFDSFADQYTPSPGASFVAELWDWQAIDITDLTLAWIGGDLPNHGLLIRHAEAEAPRATYASKDRADLRPYIEVHYATEGPDSVLRIEIAEDAFVWEAYPGSNFGDLALLYSGRKTEWTYTKQTLLRFPTPEGPEEPVYGAIGDRVWLDNDGDGIQNSLPDSPARLSLAEPGLPDITVSLYDCDGNLLDQTLTDAQGLYRFEGLLAGDYRVGVDPGQTYVFSPADQGGDDAADSDIDPSSGLSHCIALAPGEENETVDAGLHREEIPQDAALGDFVWYDADMDGIQDDNESGLYGIKVLLLDCAGNVLDDTMTDDNGGYFFGGLPPGDYMIEVAPEYYYVVTQPNAGDDDTLDSDIDPQTYRSPCVSLAAGEFNNSVDAGFFDDYYPEYASIGDYVWNDVNADGIQDQDEWGLEGVKLHLFDCDGNFWGSAISDKDGYYTFWDLPAGEYYLEIDLKEWWTFSPQHAGDDSNQDSDFNPELGATDCFGLAQGQMREDIDAGLHEFLPAAFSTQD